MKFSRRSLLGHLGIGAGAFSTHLPYHGTEAWRLTQLEADMPVLLLPPTIYAVVGQEMNVYWGGVLSAPYETGLYRTDVALTLLGEDSTRHENDRWTITPLEDNLGDGSLTAEVWQGSTLLDSQTAVLRVRGVQAAASITRRLLAIGDSTTEKGQYLTEQKKLCLNSRLTLVTVGTKVVVSGVHHEGIARKSIGFYAHDPASPFVFDGVFDFAQYLSANTITLHALDWVTVHLGINDLLYLTTDEQVDAVLPTMADDLNAMIASIQAAVPGIRIGLCTTIPPSHDQDAFGNDFGSGQTQWRYKRSRDRWLATMLATWRDQEASGVYLIPFHSNLDTRRNFPLLTRPTTTRSPVAYVQQTNSVHPAQSGYLRMADSLYAFLRGQEP